MLDGADRQHAWLHCGRRTLEKQIIGFAAAAGEDDLGRMRVDRRRNLLPRLVDRSPPRTPVFVAARRIAELAFQPRQHGRQHGRVKRRRSVVIEVGRLEHECIQTTASTFSRPIRARETRILRWSSTIAGMPDFASTSRWRATRSASVTDVR